MSNVSRTRWVLLAVALLCASIVLANESVTVTRNLTSMPLAFTENQGQWDEQVSFRANAGGATMWFTSDGAYYQFTRRIPSNSVIASESATADERGNLMDAHEAQETRLDRVTLSAVEGRHHQPDSIETMMIKASFVGANPNAPIDGIHAMEYKCNYFIGNDPNKWRTDVSNYQAIVYEEIYSGIDLKYYGNGKQMEYDFIVSPGADYSQIQIQYEGAESLSINANGELVVETKWGEVVEQRPVIYQVENSSRIAVAGEYILKGDNSFGFQLANSYNPALPLVIDPVLTYSTYLGGSGTDACVVIALDGSGNAYIAGWTTSTDFPTEGPFQDTFQGSEDAFVTKLNSLGNGLVYSTYLGGSSGDWVAGIAVDGSGNAYVTGTTWSTDFPTVGAYQTDQFWVDAFIAKLNSSGNGLVYSTYLGGDAVDYGNDIAVDGLGNAYIAGHTESSDFPTMNPYQADRNGWTDAFVTKLNSSGNALVYSTYLGGALDETVQHITVDGSGNAYTTGWTTSTDFPTVDPYQDTYQGGYRDAFVTKLNGSGNALVYSTYLGGSLAEYSGGIVVDGSGSAYITGYTQSIDFPTENPYQANHIGTYQYDVFVTKLNISGNALVYSTYLGGGNYDYGRGIAINGSGNAYITGNTISTDFPTEAAYQDSFQGVGNNYVGDAFLTKLNSSGNGLVYSTYLGGSHDDRGAGIAVDGSGNVFITGNTSSTDFPTEGEYQGYQGFFNQDAFVTKISEANDIDDDWIADADDNCPTVHNPNQDNSDNDSHGDACDNCPSDDNENQSDSDSDTVGDVCDNCPEDYNPGQEDEDEDGIGDVCDGCCMPPIRGNVDFDPSDAIDISDLVYLVDYMFNGGPEPPCIDETDVDGSGGIDISDLVYLVDYMFTGGPEPVACP